jgi:hypothetical protein
MKIYYEAVRLDNGDTEIGNVSSMKQLGQYLKTWDTKYAKVVVSFSKPEDKAIGNIMPQSLKRKIMDEYQHHEKCTSSECYEGCPIAIEGEGTLPEIIEAREEGKS